MAKEKDEFNNDRNLAEEIAYNKLMIQLGDLETWWSQFKLKEK